MRTKNIFLIRKINMLIECARDEKKAYRECVKALRKLAWNASMFRCETISIAVEGSKVSLIATDGEVIWTGALSAQNLRKALIKEGYVYVPEKGKYTLNPPKKS